MESWHERRAIKGLYKTEVIIRRNGPWRGIEEVELATLEWIDWFNNRGLFGPIGNIPADIPAGRVRANVRSA